MTKQESQGTGLTVQQYHPLMGLQCLSSATLHLTDVTWPLGT